MKLDIQPFGKTADGQPVSRFTITNRAGHSIAMTDFGATLLEVMMPDGSVSWTTLIYASIRWSRILLAIRTLVQPSVVFVIGSRMENFRSTAKRIR